MPANDLHGEQLLEIDDFSPGVYSFDNTTSTADRLVPSPKGAADAASTYSCQALPNGGLGAGPSMVQAYAWPTTIGATTYLVGFLVHDELANGNTEVIAIFEWDDGVNRKWQAYSYIVETTTATAIVSTSNATGAGLFGSPYPAMTRVANGYAITACTIGVSPILTTSWVSAANPFAIGSTVYFNAIPGGVTGLTIDTSYTVTAIGGASGAWTFTIGAATTAGVYTSGGQATMIQPPYGPVCVFPSGGPAQTLSGGQLYMYPDPSNRSAYGAFTMNPNPSTFVTGQVLVHQSRIIVLSGVGYPYPTSSFTTNENIDFTDPPLSAAMGNQQTVLNTEEPYGYGAWGSISAGELFLVKKRGGGVLVSGDIVTPTVINLPGVWGTGGIVGRADSGSKGLIYCSYSNGAWEWNGANTATKISGNIDDNFFLPSVFTAMASNNYGFYVQNIGDQTYVSNNYKYDQRNGSWWIYYPRATLGGTDMFYTSPVTGRYIYAAPLSLANGGNFLYKFDTNTPAQNYQWTSMPLTLTSYDRVCDIREIVVHTSSTATASSVVALTIINKGSVVWGPVSMTGTTHVGTDTISFNVAALGVTSPQIRITVNNNSPGDMAHIHSINIKYKARAQIGSTN